MQAPGPALFTEADPGPDVTVASGGTSRCCTNEHMHVRPSPPPASIRRRTSRERSAGGVSLAVKHGYFYFFLQYIARRSVGTSASRRQLVWSRVK